MVNSVAQLTGALITVVGVAVVLFAIEPLLLGLVVLAVVPVLLAAIRNSRQSYAFDYAMTPESRERAYLLNLMTGRGAARRCGCSGSPRTCGAATRPSPTSASAACASSSASACASRCSAPGRAPSASRSRSGASSSSSPDGRHRRGLRAHRRRPMQQLSGRLGNDHRRGLEVIESGMFLDDYRDFVALADAAATDREQLVARPRPLVRPAPARRPRRRHVHLSRVGGRPCARVSLEIHPGETCGPGGRQRVRARPRS
jgi:hypothetical protein